MTYGNAIDQFPFSRKENIVSIPSRVTDLVLYFSFKQRKRDMKIVINLAQIRNLWKYTNKSFIICYIISFAKLYILQRDGI